MGFVKFQWALKRYFKIVLCKHISVQGCEKKLFINVLDVQVNLFEIIIKNMRPTSVDIGLVSLLLTLNTLGRRCKL